MRRFPKQLSAMAGIGAVLVLLAAACGGGGDSEASSNTDNTAPSSLESLRGDIDISGSSTVEPISVRVAELFEDVSPRVRINVDGPGTGDGFKLFCDGETDISNASRAIQPSEAETCNANGVRWIELKVAIDGIAIITARNNNAIDCISYEQLYALIGPEARGFDNWSDANTIAAELGDNASLPRAELEIFGPGEESGTFDSFVELIIEDIAEARGEEATTRPDYSSSADDNVIVQGVGNSDTGIGWTGFAFVIAARDIKLLEVDGGNGCVAATEETIASGEYPVSRPLFVYINADRLEESPAIAAYIDFYLSDTGLDDAVGEVGYVPLDEDEKNSVRSNWEQRRVGN